MLIIGDTGYWNSVPSSQSFCKSTAVLRNRFYQNYLKKLLIINLKITAMKNWSGVLESYTKGIKHILNNDKRYLKSNTWSMTPFMFWKIHTCIHKYVHLHAIHALAEAGRHSQSTTVIIPRDGWEGTEVCSRRTWALSVFWGKILPREHSSILLV